MNAIIKTADYDTRWMIEVFAIAALYFAVARLGLLLAMPGGHVTPVWPPSGIALAALLLRGPQLWPGILLGSFAANFWGFYGSPMGLATDLGAALLIGAGASITALLGRQLLRQFVGERPPLERVGDVLAFLGLGGALSCLVSATVGVTTLTLSGYAQWPAYGQTWLTWWLGDTAGVFIVAPLLLVWSGAQGLRTPARWAEQVACYGMLAAVTYLVFIDDTLSTDNSLIFLLIPFLLWPALRFGQRGAATGAGLIALLAVWGTINSSGPFLGTRNEALLLLEMFMAVVVLTALCMAAMTTERERAEAAQRRAIDDLESRVLERTTSLTQSELQARRHLADAVRTRSALLNTMENERVATVALRESEQSYSALINNLSGAAYRCRNDADWTIEFISEGCQDITGYQQDDLIGNRVTSFGAIMHPADVSAVWDKCQTNLAARLPCSNEYRIIRRDGTERWVWDQAQGMYTDSGELHHIEGLLTDITLRKQGEALLQELSQRLHDVEQTERRNINRELHDRIGQGLSALNLTLNIIRNQLPADARGAVGARFDDAQKLLQNTITQVRNVMAELHPPALDDYGLWAALRDHAQTWSVRNGVPVTLNGIDIDPRLTAADEMTLLRIAQEAFINIAKHARARHVEVTLDTTPHKITLTIVDDGVGFEERELLNSNRSWGMAIMRARASGVGATLQVVSSPGNGTRVVIDYARQS